MLTRVGNTYPLTYALCLNPVSRNKEMNKFSLASSVLKQTLSDFWSKKSELYTPAPLHMTSFVCSAAYILWQGLLCSKTPVRFWGASKRGTRLEGDVFFYITRAIKTCERKLEGHLLRKSYLCQIGKWWSAMLGLQLLLKVPENWNIGLQWNTNTTLPCYCYNWAI